MSERMRSTLALAVTLAASLTMARPSEAGPPTGGQVRLSGPGFAEPIVADYLGGLASSTEVVQDQIGDTRDPTGLPGKRSYSDIRLRRIQADNALSLWRKQANEGADFRREVMLEFLASDGTVRARFHLSAAWPSSYSISGALLTRLPGTTPPRTVGVELVTIVMEGFLREP
jgi:phage tail-like protein